MFALYMFEVEARPLGSIIPRPYLKMKKAQGEHWCGGQVTAVRRLSHTDARLRTRWAPLTAEWHGA